MNTSMRRRSLRLVLASCLACGAALAEEGGQTSNVEAVADREANCGWVFPVDAYHAEIAGLTITVAANDRLLVNGRVITEDSPSGGEGSIPWGDSANTAQVARAGDLILVRTRRTDCIDDAVSRIYVLDRHGALQASSLVWTEHWRDGFFLDLDRMSIVYWSEYFCSNAVEGASKETYAHVLRPGARGFVVENRPWESLCSSQARSTLTPLRFGSMRPDLPRTSNMQ